MADPKISFADYKEDRYRWITTAKVAFYPDYLANAAAFYKPVLERFAALVQSADSAEALFWSIDTITESALRIQLWRVFRKYVSPSTSVEMLKVKAHADDIVSRFGADFRPIEDVRQALSTRQLLDDALVALLWEYKDRGQSGYDLTDEFFEYFSLQYPTLSISGPARAGKDVFLGNIFPDYPNPKRPVDFIIREEHAPVSPTSVLAVGLARYDSDRGGAQEDDRIGGYRDCADEVLRYAQAHGLNLKMVFLNDGPGLLLGSMWDDYARLERRWPGKVLVMTMRMVSERLTIDWLRAKVE